MESISSTLGRGFKNTSASFATVEREVIGSSAKLDTNLDRTRAVLTITERTEQRVAEIERSQREQSEIFRATLAAISSPEALARVFAQAMDERDSRQQPNQRADVALSAHTVLESNTAESSTWQGSMAHPKRRTRRRDVSHDRYQYFKYLSFEITNWEEDSHGIPKKTETRRTFRSALPFLKRAFH